MVFASALLGDPCEFSIAFPTLKEQNRIIEKKTIKEGRFLRFVISNYIDSYGQTREWESFERINCNGIVAIVPVTNLGELVLIKQFRPPVNGYVVEFPAGLNDRMETLEEAAHRELLEETGYSARDMIFLASGPLSSGASGEILTAYLAKGLEFKGFGQRDETEELEILKVPVREIEDELDRLKSEGNYVDLKILGLVNLAKKHIS